MVAPDPIKTLWEAVFGAGGQVGIAARVSAVEKEAENNAERLDRMNTKLTQLMLLLLSSGLTIIAGLLYLIVQP